MKQTSKMQSMRMALLGTDHVDRRHEHLQRGVRPNKVRQHFQSLDVVCGALQLSCSLSDSCGAQYDKVSVMAKGKLVHQTVSSNLSSRNNSAVWKMS